MDAERGKDWGKKIQKIQTADFFFSVNAQRGVFFCLLNVLDLMGAGDEQAGKSTLIHRLQGKKPNPDHKQSGTGLEYTYLDVKDEDGDGVCVCICVRRFGCMCALRSLHILISLLEMLSEADTGTRMGVYILDGNPNFRTLLQQVLTPANVTSTLAVVVVDMGRPWTLARSLETWLGLLSEHLATLGSSELEENKAKCEF